MKEAESFVFSVEKVVNRTSQKSGNSLEVSLKREKQERKH